VARGSKGVGTALTWRGALGFWRLLVLRVSAMAFRPLLDALLSTGLASAGLLRRGLQPTKKNNQPTMARFDGAASGWLGLLSEDLSKRQPTTQQSTENTNSTMSFLFLLRPGLDRRHLKLKKDKNNKKTTTQHATTSDEQRRSTRQPATNNDKQTVARRTGNNQPRIKKQTINLPFFFWLSSHLTGPPRLLRFWAVTGEMGEKTSVFPPTNKPPNPAQHGTLGLINLRSQRFDKCPKNYFVSLK
jgi:hypothetical protein